MGGSLEETADILKKRGLTEKPGDIYRGRKNNRTKEDQLLLNSG